VDWDIDEDGNEIFSVKVRDVDEILAGVKLEILEKELENVCKCRRCNRPLTDSVSATAGIGPICAEKERELGRRHRSK
jgi:hypothetical protein